MKKLAKRWQIALQALPVVLLLVLLKFVLAHYGLEFITIHPLYTSIVAGGIFLFGMILAGTLSDYKESERLPAEIVSACESIYQEGKYCKKTKPAFDMAHLCQTLNAIIIGFRVDVDESNSRKALSALSELTASFLEMERLDVPVQYIARLKSEESIIRKNLLRF